ncbi:MAG TPA: hypothetical protein VD969_02885 [Symbiobacteriaceae bacterium]|nr:hypothetical protein [Symbiobacteriaceae bacterium]
MQFEPLLDAMNGWGVVLGLQEFLERLADRALISRGRFDVQPASSFAGRVGLANKYG